MQCVTQHTPQTIRLWWGAAQMYAYSIRKPVKHCLKIGGKERFGGVGREQAMLPHVDKTNVDEEEKLKSWS